ncbi:hypothetical protein K445DRAFT_18020 [Daldinia sp. EC12]|nr:hypothetical protein K445DRAFT_18020 [Daldinia sp. EC12]
MASSNNHTTGLLAMPRELRDSIYNYLEDEDVTSLAQTCKQIRSEVLSTLPGGNFVDFGNFQTTTELRNQIKQNIEVKNLDLIAEPWYSPGSALKIGVTWKPKNPNYTRWRTSYWTISDLASPMARYIYLYRPKTVSITFEAATKGNYIVALLILRAKLFDINRILTTMERDWNLTPDLSVRFRGGRDPDHPFHPCKSFWEMRPGLVPDKRMVREARWEGEHLSKSVQNRQYFPFYYEYLILPLMSRKNLRPEAIEFDIEPADRQSSFYELVHTPNFDLRVNYLGYQGVLQFAQLSYGLHKQKVSYFGMDRSDAFEHVMSNMENFTDSVDALLEEMKGQEADQLRSYLRRMRNARACNPFAGPLEANLPEGEEKQQPGEKYLWRCYAEDNALRGKLIEWALEEEEKDG